MKPRDNLAAQRAISWKSAVTNKRTADALRLGLVAGMFLLGGASRADAMTQPFIQLLSICAIFYFGWVLRYDMARLPWLALFPVAAIAGLCLVQIVPLPPFIWEALPGRALLADINSAAGLGSSWRPISIQPQATIAALLGMLVPAAALVLAAGGSVDQDRMIVITMLSIAVLSAFIGILQVGADSFYFYRITNQGAAVGLFANRNHHAIFLATTAPMAAYLALHFRERRHAMTGVAVASAGIAIVSGLVILISGSRLGAALYLLGLVSAAVLFFGMMPRNNRIVDPMLMRPVRMILGGLAAFVVVGTASLLLAGDRLLGLTRLAGTDVGSEDRFRLLPFVIDTAQSFMPFGAGVGTFDRAYRMHEPFETLTLAYLNHAHNELAELAVEGGVFGLTILAVALVLFVRRSWIIWRPGRVEFDSSIAIARLGSILLWMLLLGGLTDYPLRTPSLAFVAVAALIWMAKRRDPNRPDFG